MSAISPSTPSSPTSTAYRYQRLMAGHFSRLQADPDLTQRVSELLALEDFAAMLTRPLSIRETVSLILLVSLGETGARWTGLLLPDGKGDLVPSDRRGAAGETWDSLRFEAPDRLPARTVIRTDGPPPEEEEGDEGNVAPFREMLRQSGAVVCVPLSAGDGLLGVLLVGEHHPDLAGADSDFLEALSVSAAAALESRRKDEQLHAANRRLSLHVYQLQSLMDLTAGLHRAREEPLAWNLLLHGAMGHALTTRAAVVGDGRLLAARGLRSYREEWKALFSPRSAVPTQVGVIPVSEHPDSDASRALERLGLGWIVPFESGVVRGSLYLGAAGLGRAFADADRDFLSSLARQAAAAVESLRLTRAAIEKEKELDVARQIQAKFLPEAPPPIAPEWDIWGINIPCLAIGGDYFDYFDVPGGLFMVIADVSGKGAGPALIMASVQATLRAFFTHGQTGLDGAAHELNRNLHANTEPNRYTTAVLVRLDPESGRLSYLNAGHVPPLLIRKDGSRERLRAGSTVLGLFPDVDADVGRSDIAPGDTLVLYTDGLSETENEADELFDDDRIAEAVASSGDRCARDLCGELVSRARAFAATRPLPDDLTLVVVKRAG